MCYTFNFKFTKGIDMKLIIALIVALGFQTAQACGDDGKTEGFIFGQITNVNYTMGGEAGEMERKRSIKLL